MNEKPSWVLAQSSLPNPPHSSQAMDRALRAYMRGDTHMRASTAAALERRGLLQDGALTPEGFTTAVGLLPLTEQAQALGIPLRVLDAPRNGQPPELAAMEWIAAQGGNAAFSEGGAFKVLVACYAYPWLKRAAQRVYEQDQRTWIALGVEPTPKGFQVHGDEHLASYLYTLGLHDPILREEDPDILENARKAIPKARSKDVREAFRAFQRFQGARFEQENRWAWREWVGVTERHVERLHEAIPAHAMQRLTQGMAEYPFLHRGWPDLSVVQDETAKLIEVKTTDRLHFSQISTIPFLRHELGIPIEIWRLSSTTKQFSGAPT